MVHSFQVRGETVDVSLAQKPEVANSLLPALEITFYFQNRGEQVRLSDFNFKILIQNPEGRKFLLKYINFEMSGIDVGTRGTQGLPGHLILDPYLLSKIEETRGDGDVELHAHGSLIGEKSTQPGIIQKDVVYGIQIPISIPKSDWVEKMLPRFKFKDVHLIEIPRIKSEPLQKISGCLDSAWKQKHMGQYDKVLTDCRKAIEELRIFVQSQGFTKENSERKDNTNWEGYFGSDSIGEIFGKIDQQVYRFFSLAAHSGKSINLEDADYALLITHAAANYIIKKHS